MNQLSKQAKDAINTLQRCHAICLTMATVHCPETGGEHARPQHIRLMLDCAAICAFTSDAVARKSQFHNRFAALCADVCKTCADDCENIGGMAESVAICRSCVEACTQLARLDHEEILTMASQLPPSAK
jgi:hypothetical protein